MTCGRAVADGKAALAQHCVAAATGSAPRPQPTRRRRRQGGSGRRAEGRMNEHSRTTWLGQPTTCPPRPRLPPTPAAARPPPPPSITALLLVLLLVAREALRERRLGVLGVHVRLQLRLGHGAREARLRCEGGWWVARVVCSQGVAKHPRPGNNKSATHAADGARDGEGATAVRHALRAAAALALRCSALFCISAGAHRLGHVGTAGGCAGGVALWLCR